MAKNETKAERIFRKNYCAAAAHIEKHGLVEPVDALHRLVGDDYICRRTVNAVLALCDREERIVDHRAKYGIRLWKDEQVLRKAILVVRRTCNDWIDHEAEFAAI